MGRDVGGIGARALSFGKSFGAAGPEIRVSRRRGGRCRSVLQLIVKPDLWGDRFRIRLANTFGTQPITFDAIYVGVSSTGGTVVKGTNRPVPFSGSPSVSIAPGGVDVQRRCGFEAAGRRDDRRAQAGRFVSRGRARQAR